MNREKDLATKKTCDNCGCEFPRVLLCPKCNGTGDHVENGEAHKGQCSHCKGTGQRTDPNEGKGFQTVIEGENGQKLVINHTVSPFHTDQPDLCGTCLIALVVEAFWEMKE